MFDQLASQSKAARQSRMQLGPMKPLILKRGFALTGSASTAVRYDDLFVALLFSFSWAKIIW
jgi:hypothetical protein